MSDFSAGAVPGCTQQQMLSVLDQALLKARAAAAGTTETQVIEWSAEGVEMLHREVTAQWPVSAAAQQDILGFGAFVAKNVEDFNEPLANMLHTLIHTVGRGGGPLEALTQAIAALPSMPPASL